MSEMREAVGRVVCPHIYPHDKYEDAVDIVQSEAQDIGMAVVAAATPFIEAALIERLLNEAGEESYLQNGGTLAGWLRAQAKETGE